ncbi:hypothetical protein PSPO01_15419 [Paraphaeosphaeria sporulosa]
MRAAPTDRCSESKRPVRAIASYYTPTPDRIIAAPEVVPQSSRGFLASFYVKCLMFKLPGFTKGLPRSIYGSSIYGTLRPEASTLNAPLENVARFGTKHIGK